MKRKFVILSNPRTGSEYMVRLLNNHPEICCLGELFAIPPGEGQWNTSEYKLQNQPFEYLATVQENCQKPVFGYKQISNWLANSGFGNEEQFIERSLADGFTFIFMERLNLLKEYVSFAIMMEQNYGHTRTESGQIKRIQVNPQQAYAQMRKWDSFNKACKTVFSERNIPYLHLIYEHDLAESKLAKNKAYDFIGVTRVESGDPLKRTNPGRLEDIILNYNEVIEFMKQKNRFGDVITI